MYRTTKIISTINKQLPNQARNLQTTTRMSAPQGSESAKPGLVAAHAQYVKGQAVVSVSHPFPTQYYLSRNNHLDCIFSFFCILISTQDAVGSITGSTEWKQSGHEQKEEAIANMKAASQDRDASKDGYGKAEEFAGKVAGCEGMEKEGAASTKKE